MKAELRIGVLALQGAFQAHARVLEKLDAEAVFVRVPADLASINGLIIPGGESTTFLRHLERDGFFTALQLFTQLKPTFGTCAGAILLAQKVSHPSQPSLGVLDIDIERNSYGRQIHSTILHLASSLPGPPLETVFIRAPRIARTGPDVTTLARRDNSPVLVRQGHLLAATFHPELGSDDRIHRYFLEEVVGWAGPQAAIQQRPVVGFEASSS